MPTIGDWSGSLSPVSLHYEGLRELAQALRDTDRDLLNQLKDELEKVGEVVRIDAVGRFTKGVARSVSIQQTAANFETRVRAGGQAKELVVVAQRLAKTTGKRPDYGALQMTRALLPARDAKIGEAAQILEDGAVKLLHDHGF